jgi:plasmid stabilization system protein ParE
VKYHVTVLPQAKCQLADAADWWARHRSPKQAARWLDGFEEALASLQDNPERCGLARESETFPFPVRQMLYGLGRRKTHRAVFEVRDREVLVYAIRHVAQQDLMPDDI